MADILALPLAANCVDDAVAAFVPNHLTDPSAGLAELARRHPPRRRRAGGRLQHHQPRSGARPDRRRRPERRLAVPGWYTELKATAVPILGSATAMAAAAWAAGLTRVSTQERPVDVGVTESEQLVSYRFGQAPFATWLDRIGPARAKILGRQATETIRPIMRPYRPVVVFLAAQVT